MRRVYGRPPLVEVAPTWPAPAGICRRNPGFVGHPERVHASHVMTVLQHLPVRAGGGGGFGGGGGGGGGGGVFVIFYFAFRVLFFLFLTGHPIAGGIVLAAAFGLLVLAAHRAKTKKGKRGGFLDIPEAPEPPLAPPPPVPHVSVDAITAHDPAFDADTLLADVERWFFAVKHAVSAEDVSQVRRILADGPYNELATIIESYRSQGHRPVFEQLAVANTWLLSASSGDGWDQVQVRIRAGAATQDIASDGAITAGDGVFREWYEEWALARPATAVTHATDLQRHCGNCGAPLQDDLAGTCATCHGPVNARDDAWKVTRILHVLTPV